MEPNFVDEGHCDVFINESEIRLKERNENERFQKKINFLIKNDDTMQSIMKKLHEG
jgi:hypothetical protein